jgi:AcrR family transcriptional regulator
MSTAESHAPRLGRPPQADADALRDAAVVLIEQQGIDALNFRALAEMPALLVSKTAPLYHFGTLTGLMGAIAERGFERLRRQLEREKQISLRPEEGIAALARAYAEFALTHPDLYRVMHAGTLWRSLNARGPGRSRAGDKAEAKAKQWTRKAEQARDAAFAVFVDVVAAGQRAGTIRRGAADELAQILTALVDGLIFQSLEEQVDAGLSKARRLNKFRRMFEVLLIGLLQQTGDAGLELPPVPVHR